MIKPGGKGKKRKGEEAKDRIISSKRHGSRPAPLTPTLSPRNGGRVSNFFYFPGIIYVTEIISHVSLLQNGFSVILKEVKDLNLPKMRDSSLRSE
jgi:hypothetical protein